MTLEIVGLEICVPDMIWTIINFFILFFLLKYFLFRPILQFSEKRSAVIDDGRKQGLNALQAIDAAEKESHNAIKEYKEEAVKQVSRARSRSEEERKKILDQAAADALSIRHNMKEKIRKEELEARRQSASHLPDYVKILSEKLLSTRS